MRPDAAPISQHHVDRRTNVKIIDLSCPLDRDHTSAQYPTIGPRVAYHDLYTMPRDGRRVTEFTLTTHTNTHVDAPSHVFKDGKPLDELPLESFYGPAQVLDLQREALGEITGDDLEAAGSSVAEGDIVLIHTGWGKYVHKERAHPEYLAKNHPGLVESAGLWLVERKVKAVGIDCFAIRHPKLSPSLSPSDLQANKAKPVEPVHYHLLGAGIVILEQLMNLEQIAGQRVTAAFFPLPFVGIDGSPVRAVAIV